MSQKKRKLLRKQVEQQQVAENTVAVSEKHSIIQIIKENWKFLAIVSAVVFALYLNAFNGDFVSDDYATIMNNPEVGSFGALMHYFSPVTFTNFLIANIFGINKIFYHAFSILFYIAILWLLLVFLNFIVTKNTARIAIAIFAVMPIHVEAISWISGKPYLYLACLIVISFIAFVKYLEGGKWWYLLISGGSFFTAILADPPRPFSLFFVILLYLWIVNKKHYWKKAGRLVPVVLIVFLAAAAYKLPMMLGRIDIVNSGYNSSDSIFYNPFFQYPTGIPKYLQLMWLPFDLTLYHTMYVFPLWLNWLIFLNMFALIIYGYFKDKRIFFALAFFLITLLPSMAPVKVSWLVAERYGFLPSLGFCLLLAVLVESLWVDNKYVIAITSPVLMIFFAERTFMRNNDWSTNHLLWVNTCQVSPNSHNAWNNIGDDYDKLKQYDNAIKGFTQSTIVKPNYADAFHNRANILFKIGRLDLARDSYETALYYSPQLYQTYLSLTNIDLIEKRWDLAQAHALKAQSMQPDDPTSNFVVAIVYAQTGQNQKAFNLLSQINQRWPEFKQAKDALMQLQQSGVGVSN